MIQRDIQDVLALKILEGEVKKGDTPVAGVRNSQITFESSGAV